MDFDKNNLFIQSDSLEFGNSSVQTNANRLEGRTSMYRPNLPLFAELMLLGRTPKEIQAAGYISSREEAISQWGINFVDLPGTSIWEKRGPGHIYTLPKGSFNFTTYEDEMPESNKFVKGTANATISGAIITLTLSSTEVQGMEPIRYFNVDDIIVNNTFEDLSVQGRITEVDVAAHTITFVNHGGSAFTAVTDFVTAADAADNLEIVGSAADLRNGTRASAKTSRPYRTSAVAKNYNIQVFQDMWEENNAFDGPLRHMGSQDRPIAYRSKMECITSHLNKISRSMLTGIATDVTSTSDRQTFGGLNSTITTNVTTLTQGRLSLTDIDEVLMGQIGPTFSSRRLHGYCSLPTMSIIETLFNSLGSDTLGSFQRISTGFYGMPIGVIRYRNFEIHLMPCADFTNQGARTFPDPTAVGSAFANSLYLVDPEAIYMTAGNHQEQGEMFFHINENLANKEDKLYFERHTINTWLGFALTHEKTSAVIHNIKYANLNG